MLCCCGEEFFRTGFSFEAIGYKVDGCQAFGVVVKKSGTCTTRIRIAILEPERFILEDAVVGSESGENDVSGSYLEVSVLSPLVDAGEGNQFQIGSASLNFLSPLMVDTGRSDDQSRFDAEFLAEVRLEFGNSLGIVVAAIVVITSANRSGRIDYCRVCFSHWIEQDQRKDRKSFSRASFISQDRATSLVDEINVFFFRVIRRRKRR